jgi:hypothetical protein
MTIRHQFTPQAQRKTIGGFIVVTTWDCGAITQSRRMPIETATDHAKIMRKVCTVTSVTIKVNG